MTKICDLHQFSGGHQTLRMKTFGEIDYKKSCRSGLPLRFLNKMLFRARTCEKKHEKLNDHKISGTARRTRLYIYIYIRISIEEEEGWQQQQEREKR